MRDIQAKSPHVRQKRYPCHAANKIKDHKKRAIIVNIGMPLSFHSGRQNYSRCGTFYGT